MKPGTFPGTVDIDMEGMAIDLVAVCKGTGMNKKEFDKKMSQIWENTQVKLQLNQVKKPGITTP